MATIQNISTETGDVILIKTDVPIIGLIGLTDFIDDTEGEVPAASFKKELRYSVDGGLNYTSWQELTPELLAGIIIDPSSECLFEYKYTHEGADADLAFNSATLMAQLEPKECGPTYKQSVFAEFFGCSDLEVLGWSLNVTEKMYREGIVPKFIQRGDEELYGSDRDYIDYWRTVSTFFAYLVTYARRFQRFYEDENLLREYLRQYGIFTSAYDDVEELNAIARNMILEARHRGTQKMIALANEEYVIDGELLRLIHIKPKDEFIMNTIAPQHLGWCLGHSSPLYKGVNQQTSVHRFYQAEELVVNSQSSFNTDSAIRHTVDPTLDYCISVDVQATMLEAASFNIACQAFDSTGFPLQIVDASTRIATPEFATEMALPLAGYHRLKFYVRAYRNRIVKSSLQRNVLINTSPAREFSFDSLRIAELAVSVSTLEGSQQQLNIKNLSISPLATHFSTGFIQRNNFLTLWLRQRNTSLTQAQFENKLRRYFLPYNSSFKITYLN